METFEGIRTDYHKGAITLLRGWPSSSLLPTQAIERAAASVLHESDSAIAALSITPNGYEPLRAALAAWLGGFYRSPISSSSSSFISISSTGSGFHHSDPNRIAITNGASQGLATILQSFADPTYTRAVWAVEPCYFLACPVFEDAGYVSDGGARGQLRGVLEDEEGIDLDSLESGIMEMEKKNKASPGRKIPGSLRKIYKHILYCVPTFSNPSNKTMSLRRRKALVQLARRYDVLIICDDVYDMLQWTLPRNTPTDEVLTPHAHALLPRLTDLDTPLGPSPHDPPGRHFGHAVSNGSFSKLMGLGIRTGWIDAPQDFALGMSQTGSTRSGGAPSQFAAVIAYEALRSGDLERHLRMVVLPRLRKRCEVLLQTTKRVLEGLGVVVFDEGVSVDGGQGKIYGGYFIWLVLPSPGPTVRVVARRCQKDEQLTVGVGPMFAVPRRHASMWGDGNGNENGNRKVKRGGDMFERHIRLCFAWHEEVELVDGVERLGRILRRFRDEGWDDEDDHEDDHEDGRSDGQGDWL